MFWSVWVAPLVFRMLACATARRSEGARCTLGSILELELPRIIPIECFFRYEGSGMRVSQNYGYL